MSGSIPNRVSNTSLFEGQACLPCPLSGITLPDLPALQTAHPDGSHEAQARRTPEARKSRGAVCVLPVLDVCTMVALELQYAAAVVVLAILDGGLLASLIRQRAVAVLYSPYCRAG